MGMTISDIEKKYTELAKRKSSPISFGEYMRGRSEGYESELTEQRESALTDAARKLSGYGSIAESLGASGLSGGGFGKYMRAAVERERNSALREIDRAEAKALVSIKDGYEKYISDYNKKQISLRQKLISELTNERVADPEKIYRRAANSGLGENGMKNLYDDVYSAVSYYIKDSILKKVYASEISAEVAESMAKEMQLNPDDINEVRDAAEKFYEREKNESKDYMDYLESLSGRVTTSYDDPLFNPPWKKKK